MKIYNSILSQIQLGFYQAGDRVPSEIELAEAFNVSRITTKRALDMLAQQQVIVRKRGKGSYVAWQNQLAEDQPVDVTEEKDASPRPIRKIGMVVPGVANTYGLEILRLVEKSVRQRGDVVLIASTDGSLAEEAAVIQRTLDAGVDGLLMTPVNGQHYNEPIIRLSLEQFPIVFIDRHLPGLPIPGVYTDNFAAAKETVAYLFERGLRRIVFVTPPTRGTASLEQRLAGYLAACAEFGIANAEQMVIEGDHYHNAEQLLEKLNEVEGDAYISSEHGVELVVAEWLANQEELDKPRICFDYPKSSYVDGEPSVTHIQQDEATMAKTAVELLYQLIEGEKMEAFQFLSPYTLIEGKSTKNLAFDGGNTS
ncbi:GntR family transcriptional regulator [Bacillaceae bacterium SIJ1]|uniref:GntR family transcriptional regulator n=1 Tax=Litoribacterium kuwaitense TaxID=1398745 RepID=UPI0013EB1CD8|nr:GntR family transcriptional regulator [Litoribacterium kuwaitense]NGP46146.1 GntR family transcriptional regulator [Litoribacterium kuwaitense]